MSGYDENFFRYITEGSLRSAGVIVPLLKDEFGIQSVLDVGCGAGAWLRAWREAGVQDFTGLDGAESAADNLLIPKEHFRSQDLSKPWDLGRRYDFAQCMEVAEHLPSEASAPLVRSLTKHAEIIMFSAAPPGQGGQDHINERPYEFWHQLFTDNGYVGCDWVRPWVRDNPRVEPWYRFNSILYVNESVLERSATLRHSALTSGQRIVDVAPPLYQWRRKLLSTLPPVALTQFAVLKKHVTLGRRLFRKK
ncbi:MAG: hypothetical protein RJA70_97 [Pseudomonadota bacterium]|jgi:SAM-dependent methyltransferase